MIDVIRLLVFVWLTLVTLFSVHRLFMGNRQTVLVVIVAHWGFNGLPLLWDMIAGTPIYSHVNFARSATNPTTNLLHLLYVGMVPLILAFAGLPWRRCTSTPSLDDSDTSVAGPGAPFIALYSLMVLPLVLSLLSPEPSLYLRYGFVADEDLTLPLQVSNFHAFVSIASILAVTIAAALLTSRERCLQQWLITLPWALIAIYLMGKRAIIALYLILLIQRLWDLSIMRGARIPIYLGIFALVFILASASYQSLVRNSGPSQLTPERYYENFRLDYGRDHMVRTAIFAELHDERITAYRGQSTLFNLTAFVPRSWWPEKPYPYAVYMTAYALDIRPTVLGWGFTTSILDEAIVEFGWFGMLLGPLSLGFLCRLNDRNRTTLFSSMGYIICVLFLAVQLSAFFVLFLAWLAGSLWHRHQGFLTFRRRRSLAATGP